MVSISDNTVKNWLDLKLSHHIAVRLCDKRFHSWEKKEERSHLLSKWLFDTFYYMIMSVIKHSIQIIGVHIMSDHESFPGVLDGDLTCRNVLNRTIPESHQLSMEIFYIVQFCKPSLICSQPPLLSALTCFQQQRLWQIQVLWVLLTSWDGSLPHLLLLYAESVGRRSHGPHFPWLLGLYSYSGTILFGNS